MKKAVNFNEAQKPNFRLGAVISRILLILVSIPIGWFAGQLIAYGFITLLQKIGLDDNLFRFFDAITLF
jgi:hypothetical protein